MLKHRYRRRCAGRHGSRTEDPTRHLPAATREGIRRKLEAMAHADRLLAVLEDEAEDDRALGRTFGEDLPPGLVLAAQ